METKKQYSENEEKNAGYQCSMQCEKGKVYHHTGNCPVCTMKLVPVEEKSSPDSNNHYY